MNITKNSIRNKFILKMYRKNILWHLVLMLIVGAFGISVIFVPVGKMIRDTSNTLRAYEDASLFYFDLNTVWNCKGLKSKDEKTSKYNEIMYGLFVDGHEKGDYAFFTPIIDAYSPELKGLGYSIRSSGKLNYKLKEGRCFQGNENEALVYGGTLNVGDTFTIDDIEFTVVGTLDCVPPLDATDIDEEKNFGIRFFRYYTRIGNAVIVNQNSEIIKYGIEKSEYSVVFDTTKYTEEEISEMKSYGYVYPIEKQTTSVDSIVFKYIRIIAPIVMIAMLIGTIYYVMSTIRLRLAEDIGTFYARGAKDGYIKNMVAISIYIDAIVGTILAFITMNEILYSGKYLLINIVMIISIYLVCRIGIHIYNKNGFNIECLELDKKYCKEKWVDYDLTVYENLLLTALCLTNNDSRARTIAGNYLRICWLEKESDIKVRELEEKYINRLKLALLVATSKDEEIVVENLWENVSQNEKENIRTIIGNIEFRNNVDICIKE